MVAHLKQFKTEATINIFLIFSVYSMFSFLWLWVNSTKMMTVFGLKCQHDKFKPEQKSSRNVHGTQFSKWRIFKMNTQNVAYFKMNFSQQFPSKSEIRNIWCKKCDGEICQKISDIFRHHHFLRKCVIPRIAYNRQICRPFASRTWGGHPLLCSLDSAQHWLHHNGVLESFSDDWQFTYHVIVVEIQYTIITKLFQKWDLKKLL